MSDMIRRGQLIAPFGPGAITILRGGISVIGAGLDHWFKREESPEDRVKDVDRDAFRVDEPRLERLLDVKALYLPPDHRRRRAGEPRENTGLTIPVLRFPQWHTCRSCHVLYPIPLTARGAQYCRPCEVRTKKRWRLHQVRFIAMCEAGHVQDFPWREWVHRSVAPRCSMAIAMTGAGGALSSITISCECGEMRTLGNVMQAFPDGTTSLTKELEAGEAEYTCRGHRPWLGTEEAGACDRHLHGTLISATNLHFASVASALYLPPHVENPAPEELVDRLEEPPLSTFIKLLGDLGAAPTPETLRRMHASLLVSYSDDQVSAALACVGKARSHTQTSPASDTSSTGFRAEERGVLLCDHNRELLKIRTIATDRYVGQIGGRPLSDYLQHVSLVDKLRETRALTGFSRVRPEGGASVDERKALLRKADENVQGTDWLPAYCVFGEGIYLELREDLVSSWECRAAQLERVAPLRKMVIDLHGRGWGRQIDLNPTFVLLHTLAHLLMNRLTFDCGYSSASLRERLYVSRTGESTMAGVLIYTAAGDSEGTLGGLVRMGSPGLLEPVFRRALEGASWCSADPVCFELGEHGGQGPDSCNLAACHACALVPETACEQFNRFLDRGLVVGVPGSPDLGFFDIGA